MVFNVFDQYWLDILKEVSYYLCDILSTAMWYDQRFFLCKKLGPEYPTRQVNTFFESFLHLLTLESEVLIKTSQSNYTCYVIRK